MKTEAKTQTRQYTRNPLLDMEARRKARERVRGLWKNKGPALARKATKLRKEWDSRIGKLEKKSK
jgi:hypothetical protein